MSSFERRVKGKNLMFDIAIKSSVPYPSDDIRWKTYGAPLSSIFARFFDEVSVEYFKGARNKLKGMHIVCFKPNFSYKKSEERVFYTNLFNMLSNSIQKCFEGLGIEAEMAGIYVPSVSSIGAYGVAVCKAKIGKNVESDKKAVTYTPFELPIIKSPIPMGDNFFDTDYCPYCGEVLRGKAELHIAAPNAREAVQECLNVLKKSDKVWINPDEPLVIRTPKGKLFVFHEKNGKKPKPKS